MCCPHPQHKHNRPRDSRSDGKRRPSRRPPRRRLLHLSSFPSPSTADSLETPYSHGCFLALVVNRSLYVYNSLIDHLWLLHGVAFLLSSHVADSVRRRRHPPHRQNHRHRRPARPHRPVAGPRRLRRAAGRHRGGRSRQRAAHCAPRAVRPPLRIARLRRASLAGSIASDR